MLISKSFHSRFRIKANNRGLTLMEIMVALVILTVGVLSFVGVFGGILKTLHNSKGRTLASNLAQEQIESLKNLNYYRLLVTTSAVPAQETGVGSFYYDNATYPSETLVVGEMTFVRRVYIQKVTENAGTLVTNNWWDNDTGLKLVTAYIIWQENGEWKKVTMTNLRDNPNRKKMDAGFSGTILSTGGAAIQSVTVLTLQDPLYKSVSNASGVYGITVPAGNYDLKASKRGYFTSIKNSTATANSTTSLGFTLSAMGAGTITGTAYLATHLVVSAICVTVNGDTQLEYVELFNPTNSTFTIGSGSLAPNYQINYVKTSNGNVTTINPTGVTRYINSTILSRGYYVIGSSAAISGVTVDAYYSSATLSSYVPEDRLPSDESGGIALVSLGTYETSGSTIDAVGWGKSGGSPYGPALAREGGGIQLSGGPGANGLASEEVLQRISYSSATASTMDLNPAGVHSAIGRAYDTDVNSVNWVQQTDTFNDVPRNSSTIHSRGAATPAIGGLVFSDDGLSASTRATTSPLNGSFTITSVATGSWAVLVSSNGYAYTQENSTVTNGNTLDIGPIFITSAAAGGFVGGRVVTSGGTGVGSIIVSASGGSDTTDSNGTYLLPLSIGTYTVTANANNANTSYTTGNTTGVAVVAGNLTTAPDITIYQGGILRGFVSTNGTDPLPGIPIVATATATGAEVGSAISNSQGFFSFPDLPVGGYVLSPQLETGESASPTSMTKTVIAGTTVHVGSFTVSNAFGRISGTVSYTTGARITTGVLIIAVPSGTTIGSNPPTNNQTLRNAGVYYYTSSSNSDGTYEISARGGITYNMYAWYTSYSGSTPTTTQQTGSAVLPVGGSTTVNFTW
jgi:prepilin-type N-terminal cleavage/methylation domain-containing protein